MPSVDLRRTYLHLASDPSRFLTFPEAAADRGKSVRSGVRSNSDGSRRKVGNNAVARSARFALPVVPRSLVDDLEEWVGRVVLLRSPTGEYRYGQLLAVRGVSAISQADSDMTGASLVLDPVDYEGLI